MSLILGFGLLAIFCFCATKLETTELAFVVLGGAAVGSWAGVPHGALLNAAGLAFVIRFICYNGTGR